jgi:hypothetical protein
VSSQSRFPELREENSNYRYLEEFGFEAHAILRPNQLGGRASHASKSMSSVWKSLQSVNLPNTAAHSSG